MISVRSSVWISEWRYRVLIFRSARNSESSSASFLVSVVMRTRSPRAIVCLHLADHIVGLPLDRPDLDIRVDKTGRADDLLDRGAGLLQLVLAGCCRDEDHVAHVLLELVELQGPVVVRAREPEPVIDQGLLARAVAVVHPVELRDHLVALIDDHQEVVREIIEQAVGFLAGLPPVKVPGVVLDALALSRSR